MGRWNFAWMHRTVMAVRMTASVCRSTWLAMQTTTGLSTSGICRRWSQWGEPTTACRSSNWSAHPDFNGDGYINVGDLQKLVGNWADEIPPGPPLAPEQSQSSIVAETSQTDFGGGTVNFLLKGRVGTTGPFSSNITAGIGETVTVQCGCSVPVVVCWQWPVTS